MHRELESRSAAAVWQHFSNILSTPHPSHHEQGIKEYVRSVAERAGAEVVEDEAGNLIVRKAATAGMEDREAVILQAHLDMVPQSEVGKPFDFLTDPIETYIDGEWLKASGTTLGADNGIGVAAALAVLESDAPHGDMEILLTINEEDGMEGAFGLQPEVLKGSILLNLDTEVEGELCIGCAGGLSLNVTFEHPRSRAPKSGYVARRLCVSGLRGGHSGIQINEQRGNANKLLFRLLRLTKVDILVSEFSGGTLNNAIPREASTDILINIEELEIFEQQVRDFEQLIRGEFASIESNISVTLEPIEMPKSFIDEQAASCIVWAAAAVHDGVYRYSYDMAGLVDTSSNFAIIRSDEDTTTLEFLLRSTTEAGKVELADAIASVFELADAEVCATEGYPGWKPNVNSPILSTMQSTYRELFGSDPEVKAVHAGLECGIIGEKYPELDMISFGPTIVSPHSPAEMANIPSVDRFYTLLLSVLQNIPRR